MAFCGNCGTQYNEGAYFCPSCRAPLAAQAVSPGYVPPPQPSPYGGDASPAAQASYSNYAPQIQPAAYDSAQAQQRYSSKNKIISIVLAVLFSYWTWLYTFKRDRVKFFIALILALAAFIGYYVISRFTYVSLAITILLWIWPLTDTLRKKPEWYAGY